jgi:hypothetical protein
MTVRWWRVLAVWPLAFTLSVAGTVLVSLVTAAAQDGDIGVPGEIGYLALWVALLAVVPAVVVGTPVLVVAAVVLRTARLEWQVLAVGGVAAWVAAGCTAFLNSPWGPLRWHSIDPAASYNWGDVALLVAIAALGWSLGTGSAWAVVRPVRPARVARTTPA